MTIFWENEYLYLTGGDKNAVLVVAFLLVKAKNLSVDLKDYIHNTEGEWARERIQTLTSLPTPYSNIYLSI